MTEDIWKNSYYTTTYKVRLYIKQLEYLKLTNNIYNELIKKYFDILYEKQDLLDMSSFNCLAELERLTIIPKTGPRKGEIPELYFEQDAPLYLRRAAINQAIGNVKIQLSNEIRAGEKKQKLPTVPKAFNHPTIFYKGMYKELKGNSITLKLYDGVEWKWVKAKLAKFEIPENAEILSPTIVIYKNYILAHIPIKQPINDITPIRFRMQKDNIRVCGVMFTNTDKFAVCVILDENGKFLKSKFISGGNEFKERTGKIYGKIKKYRKPIKKDHSNYWGKLYKISNHYAHKVSREITDFCIENNVKVLSFADYKNNDENMESNYKRRVGLFSPIGLREKIIKDLTYKTFKEGILITKVRPNYILRRCYKCRGVIRRKIKDRKETEKFRCKNGHEGDYYFNGAMNVAIMCLKKFGKEIQIQD